MDFAQQQRNPGKHVVGIVFVILFHALLAYLVFTGMASRMVEVIKKPLEAKIVEEVKPPPPPPEIKLPPPPKMVAPPPPYIPPPEVAIATPPVNNVTVATVAPPVQQFTPAAPSAPAPGPAAPAVKSVGVVCPNVTTVSRGMEYPVRAARAGINEGEVKLTFVVTSSGEVTNLAVVSTTNRLFNDTATSLVKLLKCQGQGQDQPVSWTVGFRSE